MTDTDQQQAEPTTAEYREGAILSAALGARFGSGNEIARALAAARAPGDRLRERLTELVSDMARAIDSGYYGGSEYEDATARLRAALDETR